MPSFQFAEPPQWARPVIASRGRILSWVRGEIGASFSSWQQRLASTTARHVRVSAGRRSGKSTIASWLGLGTAAAGGLVFAAAPRYEQADLVWGRALTQARRSFPDLIDERTTSQARGVLAFHSGGVLVRRSVDAKGGNVGWGTDLVVIDEAARCQRRAWEQDLRPTLADRRGSSLWITTPGGYDWIYEDYTQWQRGESEDTEWITAPSWENLAVFPGGRDDPTILAEERAYRAAGLEALFRQEFGGEFVQLTGQVFPRFNASEMIRPKAEVAHGVTEWFVGYDWGWGHHSAFVLVGRVGGRAIRVVDEWGAPYAEPEALWAGLSELVQRNRLRPEQVEIFPDPSRPEQAAQLRRRGWTVIAAENDTATKILSVASAMAAPGGFLISTDARITARQLAGLHHAPPTNVGGDVRVVKVDDDYADCVMYVCASLAKRERRGIGLHAHGAR